MKRILNKIEPYFFLMDVAVGVMSLALSLFFFEMIYASLHSYTKVNQSFAHFIGDLPFMNMVGITFFLIGSYFVRRGYYHADF